MAKGKEEKGEREEDKEGKARNTGVQLKELCLWCDIAKEKKG